MTRFVSERKSMEQIDLTALALAALDAIRKQQEEQNNETK